MSISFSEDDFDQRDTLCYVFDGQDILMIEKKRGPRPDNLDDDEHLLNGPGGGIEDETPEECAVRELEEETGIKAQNVEKVGEIGYYENDNAERFIHVYTTTDYCGEPRESDEAIPLWMEQNSIDYKRMWPSDSYWMPDLIDGKRFRTRLVYENGSFLEEQSEKDTEVDL